MKKPRKFFCEDLQHYFLEHPKATLDEAARFFNGTRHGLCSALRRCKIHHSFTDRDIIDSHMIVEYAISHPESTSRDIATALNYRYNTVYKALKRLGKLHLVKKSLAGRPRKVRPRLS